MPPVVTSVTPPPASTPVALGSFVVGQSSYSIAPNRDVVLTFRVTLGGDTGAPIAGVRADFAIVGSANGAMLGSDYLMTGDDGTVSVRLRAGMPAKFIVQMSTEGAPPTSVAVNVSGVSAGNVVARVGYSGTDAIDRVDVRLHDGRASCGALASTDMWPNALPATVQTVSVPGVSTDARFNNLTSGGAFTVTAVAYSANGKVVGTGCSEVTVTAQRDVIANTQLAPVASAAPEPTIWERFLAWLRSL